MRVRSAVLRAARAGTNRGSVRLEVVFPAGTLLEPLRADTSLQIADASGQLYCATIGTTRWRQRGKQNFVFRDERDAFAGGLAEGRVRRRRDGSQTLMVRGARVPLRVPEGGTLAFTVRGGGTCAHAVLNVAAARKEVGVR
jgi:hypothetical protein